MFKLKNIPNFLSCIRILMVGLFVYVFFNDYPNNLIYALIVFLSAGLTDVIDGCLARKFNWVSDLGKILDPLADKLMQCTVLVCMLIKDLIPIWLVIPFIIKELIVLTGGLFVLKKQSFVVSSNIYGKMTVVFFYAIIASCMMAREYLAVHPTVLYLLCALVLAAGISALINYIIKYNKSLKIGHVTENVNNSKVE